VVNNYLLGNKAPAFDLLYWNSDGTRMTRAAHSWYLRNTYVENNLIKPGKITLKGEAVDLGRICQDTYAVGCEKDHIVPWDSAWRITQLFGGEVRYVLASSGHVAGIINPPGGKELIGPERAMTGWRAAQRSGGRARRSTKAAGGRTGRHGSLPDRARRGRPLRWGVRNTRRCRMRRERMFLRSSRYAGITAPCRVGGERSRLHRMKRQS
jgi:hypothetical protein